MALTVALVTDIHFGVDTRFEGKLRKLSGAAPRLLDEALSAIAAERPSLLVNLGDDIEDEGPAVDRQRYAACQQALRRAPCPVMNVAGNHDTIHLTASDLAGLWGTTGHLHYALDHGGVHFVVLHTVERKDRDVRVDADQLAWLREDLARTRLRTIVLMHHPASEQDLGDSRWFRDHAHLALVAERAELRRILRESGRVAAVFNGHVHRNHLDVIDGIPYVTVQSLIENLDEDAPGRPARAFAVARIEPERIVVRVHGDDPARYQFELGPGA